MILVFFRNGGFQGKARVGKISRTQGAYAAAHGVQGTRGLLIFAALPILARFVEVAAGMADHVLDDAKQGFHYSRIAFRQACEFTGVKQGVLRAGCLLCCNWLCCCYYWRRDCRDCCWYRC